MARSTSNGPRRSDPTAILSGALFTLIGAGFLVVGMDYSFGTLRTMGPGFFPRVLAILLIALGLISAATEKRAEGEDFSLASLNWRALACVTLAALAFALLSRPLGVAPAIFIAVLIVSRAMPGMGFVRPVVLALAISIFSVLAFVEGLGLPMRAFGPWLSF